MALGAITYSALRWKLPRTQALLLGCLLLAIPAVIRWAGSGGADLLLALFHVASVFFLVKWLEEADWRDLLAAALFTGYASLTKAEGMALAAINAVVLVIFSLDAKNWKKLLGVVWFAFGVAVLLMPWVFWSGKLPHTHDVSAAGLVSNLPELWRIMRAFTGQLAGQNTAGWGGVWVLLVLAAALGWRGFLRKNVIALWTLLAANLFVYALVLTTKPWVRDIDNVDALERLLLHSAPVAICLVGYHWVIQRDSRQTSSTASARFPKGSRPSCVSGTL
jgi:4-amino-4-deoxy-L-arabinose transferase-like glycosyltransferase